MLVKDLIKFEIIGRAILISIEAPADDILRLLNSHIEYTLDFAVRFDIIKKYSNRIDRFFIVPQQEWQPAEVIVELKKLLRL